MNKETVEAISSKDYKLALSLLDSLVSLEVPRALGVLGLIYQCGEGVEVDALKAIELLEKAMQGGDGTAAHNLGTIYISNYPNVPADRVKSKMYYRKAKEMGCQFAPDEFYE